MTEGGLAVSAQAQQKGFGRPGSQSVDTVGDVVFSWTLGEMVVLEAPKEVPHFMSSCSPHWGLL